MRGNPILTVVVALLVLACGGPDAARYVAVLDELRLPADWELAHTTVSEPGGAVPCETVLGSCPAVYRYYRVTGRPADAYPGVTQMIVDASFEIDREYRPGCVGLSGDDRVSCYLIAVRGADLLYVHLFEPGVDPDELGIAKEGQFVIRLGAYANPEQEDAP